MDVDEVLRKYSKKIEEQVKSEMNYQEGSDFSSSREYFQFKQDMMPEITRYEKYVKLLGNFLKLRLSQKDGIKIQKNLDIAHLNVSPGETAGLAVFSFLVLLIVGTFLSIGIYLVTENFPVLFLVLIIVTSFFLFYYFYSMPSRLAIKWRLKTSSQMVPAVLYTVIYMKHSSNLERAINFVSQHIDAPLSLDFKKVIWDVQTGKYSSVKDSLDAYLDFWRDSNMEFVESFHLIESSLYEPDEQRRIQILERALRVILDGVYDKMLKYTHSIKSPLTNVYMLGIVLPTLGLALLPLASTLLGGVLKSSHIFVIFNIIIPFFVFYLTLQIMLKRPGGYGETSLLEQNPLYYQYASKKPYYISSLVCLPFLLFGILPLIFGYTPIPNWIGLKPDYSLSELGLGFLGIGNIFGFIDNSGAIIGPFGIISLLLSLFVPFSVAMFFALSYSIKTKEIIKSRDHTKELENEFNSTLFSLGNRLGDGLPAEIAFGKVAESTRGQRTENFFRIVHSNIQSMGMSLEDAIFNSKRGALVYYPSSLIETSMRILVESVKKGLNVASQSLMSISEYVRNIQKINERLRDLLAEIVSDMKSNMTFLAPLLAGIVIGLASMITAILNQLKELAGVTGGDTSLAGFSVAGIVDLFDVANIVPPYFMQIAIGIYIIEIIFILTTALVTIDAGEDKLKKTYDISKNLIRGMMLYLVTAMVSIIALSLLSGLVLKGLVG